MSTWQISSDAGNNFRWEISGRILQSKPDNEPNGAPIQQPHNSTPRLPSMADLLLQGCSKLLENRDEGDGNSVVLKQSSITFDSAEANARDNGCNFSNSFFQTGSGKMVNISSAGLVRAKTLLGLDEDNDGFDFQGLQHTKKQSTTCEPCGWQNSSHLELKEGLNHNGIANATSIPRSLSICKTGSIGSKWKSEVNSNGMQCEMRNSAPKPPQIKFQTAGGKSLSVSSDALQRARSLLGDPELGTFLDEGDVDDPAHSFFKERRFDDTSSNTSSNKENEFYTPFSHQGTAKSKIVPKIFISPLRSSSKQVRSVNSENVISGSNLIKKFDAADNDNVCGLNGDMPSIQKPLSNMPHESDRAIDNSFANGIGSRTNPVGSSLGGPLVDISNRIGTAYTNNKQITSQKRRFGISSVSPFKRPRSSKFTTPLNENVSHVPNGLSTLSSEHSCSKRTISTRYPFPFPRMYIKEYFGVPPSAQSMLEHMSDQIRWIKSDNADKHIFCDESGLNGTGAEAFFHMLARSGASRQYASEEWVTNHYKWIVWKLACYERCYPDKSAGKFLTVSNVLEELKYRYEREVNHGHRSAIKRILEGDASPSSMLVLCISAIHPNYERKIETHLVTKYGADNSDNAKVELTDGWYSVDALLDVLLTKQLVAGKLFVGQKLRIWGAALCGWVGPVSPLEASRTVSLLLNINGTYRAHWADRLGFCKGVRAPLAFRCIKSNGGPVPRTLVGVTRIYPVLYKEKLSDGGSIVRSERMETKRLQLYNQRCFDVVEGIISDYQRGNRGSHIYNDSDSEGAKILKVLETAAEPEVLMAEMSSEQLTSFATYKAKLEATRESEMEKSIQKALEDAGLSEREVTPFMRVRVVGLTSEYYQRKRSPKEGIITIWNPTEKQRSELVEGQAYAVAGLVPVNSDSETLYLQARGSTTEWLLLSPLRIEHFMPFFSPRKSVLLSNLGEVPLSSEFDIAAFVVHVGEVHTTPHQKKQWVFVADGSISKFKSGELPNSLLAICFCSPHIDDDSFAPINYNLEGSTVGFCNLIKRAKDQMNHMWVAEATENSTYFLSFDTPHCSHLKNAGQSAQSWAKISSSIIDKLREKVLFIIGDCKG